jgi:hypothetical protein
MPSAFDENFSEGGAPMLMEQLGVVVTYAAAAVWFAGGGTIQASAMVDTEGAVEREEADGGRHWEMVRTVTVSLAEIADPGPNDVVLIAGVQYEVRSVVNKSDTLTTLECVRTPGTEITKPGYRAAG